MPGFVLTGHADAPVEEVWKLMFDPTRFPKRWAGVDTVEPGTDGAYTMWPDGYPDFPMPQQLRVDNRAGRVVVSCQGSNLDITWRLPGDDDTEITVPGGPARARGPSTDGPTRVDQCVVWPRSRAWPKREPLLESTSLSR